MCYTVCHDYRKMAATSLKKKSNRNVLNILGGRNLKVLNKDLWKSLLKFV